ncbi:Uncharacterised protein [Mycobacteroides abscessus subsp. abscessus]|nr:Uncharacterised protein [Mycobacteroides abscessus subsp. abscessus]
MAAWRRSEAATQCLSPSRSTQEARAIRVNMPSVTAPLETAETSSSWRPSGMTSRPTRLSCSARRATASLPAILVRSL